MFLNNIFNFDYDNILDNFKYGSIRDVIIYFFKDS